MNDHREKNFIEHHSLMLYFYAIKSLQTKKVLCQVYHK